MKKNPLALAVYRSVKAANDEGSSAAAASPASAPPHVPLSELTGWDPFEVWRTRIHVVVSRTSRRKR